MKKKLSQNSKKIHLKKINTIRDYINIDQLSEILNFMIFNKVNSVLNVGSSKPLNLINLTNIINIKYRYFKTIKFEKKKYPGFCSNINLLRKLGYKKKILNFKI